MLQIPLLAAAAENILQDVSTLHPVSPPAESIRYLFYFVVAVALVILAVVWGVLFYSLARFRQKKNTGGASSPSGQPANSEITTAEPPQVYGSLPIEIAWTVAPGIIVLLLALVIVRTELEVRIKAPATTAGTNAVTATVIGHQWWWEYVIEQNGDQTVNVVTANELHVPASGGSDSVETLRPVYLTLKSADVCHSFWVPRLAGKTDLIPGKTNQMWFQTTQPGLYFGQCAEYCGAQHANMLLRVYVDTPETFAAWLANEQKPAVDDAAMREGRQAFLAQSCVNCHTIRGTTAKGKFGPDLTHLAARETFAGGMIKLNRDNLRLWIRDPQQIKGECLMPAFGLSDRNVDLITDYLMTLK
ncbi:MAG TPA: cytochrome c oxidase subunit II [Pirellulales bacterium]|jgi:cytochrome c oxidase subunit 2|nr:cytochrome c oxidase subunit II [Pirellulales bacterium]